MATKNWHPAKPKSLVHPPHRPELSHPALVLVWLGAAHGQLGSDVCSAKGIAQPATLTWDFSVLRKAYVTISNESPYSLTKLVSKKLGFGGSLPRFSNPPSPLPLFDTSRAERGDMKEQKILTTRFFTQFFFLPPKDSVWDSLLFIPVLPSSVAVGGQMPLERINRKGQTRLWF